MRYWQTPYLVSILIHENVHVLNLVYKYIPILLFSFFFTLIPFYFSSTILSLVRDSTHFIIFSDILLNSVNRKWRVFVPAQVCSFWLYCPCKKTFRSTLVCGSRGGHHCSFPWTSKSQFPPLTVSLTWLLLSTFPTFTFPIPKITLHHTRDFE